MIDWLTEAQLQYGHIIKPLIVGTMVSIVCSVVGCFIVLRKMSFLADAIAHAMIAGVIGGYLFMKILFGQEAELGALLFGAILAGMLTVAAIGFVTQVSRIKQDTAIGIMYTGLFALGACIVSIRAFGGLIHIDIYHYFLGSVIAVSNQDLWLLAIVTSIVLSAILLFYRQLQLTSFDPIMAASIGVPVLAIEYLLTACTSLVVVSGVQIAGVILVIGLIITPAASAYLLTDRLDRMIFVAMLMGVFGFLIGFALATWIGADPGPTVVVAMTVIFIITLTFAPRYGLIADIIRKSNTVPQEIMEDVLGAMLREQQKSVPLTHIFKRVETQRKRLQIAMQKLDRQGLIEIDQQHAQLTEVGRREANRLVRAHRLWETYLERTGAADTDIHEQAHKLEHISDQATVEYLDDRLGHPLTDPHGSEIPVDESNLVSDKAFKLSLLRAGNRARVQRVNLGASQTGLKTGDTVLMNNRSPDGKTWRLTGPAGQLELDHAQADEVLVVLVQPDSS